MAIQEIEKEEAKGTLGIKRGINQAAQGMVMDIVQSQQYTKPIPSTVRELAANAVDSQTEKQNALKILSGEAKVEDFFITREGDLYKDSKWKPDYFSPEHLSSNNTVELTYYDKPGTGRCDVFSVKDYGVGIGGRRLQGVFEIGFSTKRNRTDGLGAFGLGAKVGLATGADYYKMTTVYNGVRYRVQIFNKKVNSLVGKMDFKKEIENVPYDFLDEEGNIVGTIYGERTDEKNYTEIEVPALKHHKQDYITAVKTQLLYFNNVRFFVTKVNDGFENDTEEIHFKANPLYNSQNLIISQSSPYSKPHVVIIKGGKNGSETGVCYGHIEFKEMELQEMNGDIGIKCPIRQVMTDDDGNEVIINEGVDVIPSREAVRWTPATREFLKKQFEQAQVEATDLVEDELKEEDFLKWITACKNVSIYGNSSTAVGRLSKIVDFNTLTPTYKGKSDVKIKFVNMSKLFNVFKLKRLTKFEDRKEKKFKIKRDDIVSWSEFDAEKCFYKLDNTKRLTDMYLCDQNEQSIITISPMSKDELWDVINSTKSIGNPKEAMEKLQAKQEAIIKLLQSSSDYLTYDDTVVPEDYIKQLNKVERELDEEAEKERVMTPAERRKLEEKVVANTLIPTPRWSDTETTYRNSKVEPKIKTVENYTGNMFYGFQKDLSKLHLAAHILDVQLDGDFNTSNYSLLSISKNNEKYFSMQNHIDDFFGVPVLVKDKDNKVKGIEIMFDNAVTKWNTARKLYPYMESLLFLENFSIFNEGIASEYNDLKVFIENNYAPLNSYKNRFGMKEHYSDFIKFLDSIEELQVFIEEEKNADEISQKVKDIINGGVNLPETTVGGIAIDREKIKTLEKLLEYAKPVKDLLNHIPLLTTNEKKDIPIETVMLIEEYLQLKNLKK